MSRTSPAAAHFVVDTQQLVAEFTEEDAKGVEGVLVVGMGLDAATVMHALISRGVPAGKVGQAEQHQPAELSTAIVFPTMCRMPPYICAGC